MGMERTFQFLNESFRDYYQKAGAPNPPGFQKREFGFLYHGETTFRRHIGFPSPEVLKSDIVRKPPAHLYHSSAYYTNPSAHTMADKGWEGADLIFDLDADHLSGAEKMSYAEMLHEVKRKFITLVDDYLVHDFGYGQKDLYLVFSGGRGYHAHVRDPRVRGLQSPLRREIVDYITGKIDLTDMVTDPVVDVKGRNEKRTIGVPPVERGGWGGKLTKSVHAYLKAVASSPEPEDAKISSLATEIGIGPREAKAIIRALSGTPENVGRRLGGLLDGKGALFEGIGIQSVRALYQYQLDRLKGWCDEPVSSDIKRLIRAPLSLHGKTGLKVTPLTRDQLDDFDPLIDAVALDDEPVKLVASPAAKPFTLKGQEFKPAPGLQTLPRYAAVFLILRRQALLEGDTPPAPPPPKPAPAAAGGA
jgi:DNA primase small subunit